MRCLCFRGWCLLHLPFGCADLVLCGWVVRVCGRGQAHSTDCDGGAPRAISSRATAWGSSVCLCVYKCFCRSVGRFGGWVSGDPSIFCLLCNKRGDATRMQTFINENFNRRQCSTRCFKSVIDFIEDPGGPIGTSPIAELPQNTFSTKKSQ